MTSQNNPKSKEELIAILLLVGFFGVLAFTISVFYSRKEICLQYLEIIKVGACNQEGKCSVLYSNGSYGTMYLPIEGKKECLNTKNIFWWNYIL
jgi:hypothetical protein